MVIIIEFFIIYNKYSIDINQNQNNRAEEQKEEIATLNKKEEQKPDKLEMFNLKKEISQLKNIING